MEECEVSPKRDGGRMEQPLRVIVVGGGVGGWMMGGELVGGGNGWEVYQKKLKEVGQVNQCTMDARMHQVA